MEKKKRGYHLSCYLDTQEKKQKLELIAKREFRSVAQLTSKIISDFIDNN